MARENDFGPSKEKGHGEECGPVVPAMMGVDDVITSCANFSRNRSHEMNFERAFGRSGYLGYLKGLQLRRKLRLARPHDSGIYTQRTESCDDLDALVIGAATAKHRVKMENFHN
jgi:hypothetical protein